MRNSRWRQVEPGRKRLRRIIPVVCGVVLFAIFALMVGSFVRSQWWQWDLRRHGVDTQVTVADQQTSEDGDGNTVNRLLLEMPGCDCWATVTVDTLDGHPAGSLFPVRYDPKHPTHVEPLTDRPQSSAWSLLFCIPMVVIAGGALLSRSRQKRRNRELLTFSDATRQVTFRTWRRACGDSSQTYLELFDLAADAPRQPLLCVPVSLSDIGKLHAHDVLSLYGSGEPGTPIALRRNGVIILPRLKSKPGLWEAAQRGHAPQVADRADVADQTATSYHEPSKSTR
jgi:hypothetical protein